MTIRDGCSPGSPEEEEGLRVGRRHEHGRRGGPRGMLENKEGARWARRCEEGAANANPVLPVPWPWGETISYTLMPSLRQYGHKGVCL